jgi:hypothetical protein
MSARRTPILIGLIALVVVAAFWTQVLGPKRKEAADLRDQVASVQSQLEQTRAQAVSLRSAKTGFGTDYTSTVRLGKAVPTDDDVRSLVVQLDAAAKRSGVDFRTIQLAGGGGTTTPPAATTGAAATQATTATLPPGASVGAAGFPTMPFSFEFKGEFFTLSNFFRRLDHMVKVRGQRIDVSGRLLTVDAFSLKPGSKGFPTVEAAIGATAYLLPGSNGATIATPAAASTSASGSSAAAPAISSLPTPSTGADR